VSEVEIDKQLTGRRAAKPGFVECSFPTIAGAQPLQFAVTLSGRPMHVEVSVVWVPGFQRSGGVSLCLCSNTMHISNTNATR